MPNRIIKAFKWIFAIKSRQDRYVYPLDPDLIKDKTVQELIKKIQSQDAQLSNIFAEKKKREDLLKDTDKKDLFIKDLKEQKQEIDQKRYENPVSLRKIFQKIIQDKKYIVDITDKDDTVTLGRFKDIVFLPGNFMGVIDTYGNIVSYGKTPSQIIYKPESLANQLRRKRIALPCDKEGIFYPDLESYEIPECVYDDATGKIQWAKFRKNEVKKMVVERENIIHQLTEELKYNEQLIISLKRKLNDKERAGDIYKNKIDITQTDLSMAMEKCLQYEQRFGEMQNRIVTLIEMKNIADNLYHGLENVNRELIEKSEEMGTKTEFRKALDVVQGLLSWAKDKIPKTIIQTPVKEIVEKEIIKPGQSIK